MKESDGCAGENSTVTLETTGSSRRPDRVRENVLEFFAGIFSVSRAKKERRRMMDLRKTLVCHVGEREKYIARREGNSNCIGKLLFADGRIRLRRRVVLPFFDGASALHARGRSYCGRDRFFTVCNFLVFNFEASLYCDV